MTAVLRGLRPAPGAVRLLALRAVVVAVLSARVYVVLRGALTGPCGFGPCGPEPGMLDVTGLSDVLRHGGTAAAGIVLAAVAAFWAVDQVLTAAAL